jgi:hypothetical protein
LANFFYRHREEYVRQLNAARFEYNGNLTEFVKFSLGGFVQEIQGVQDEILDFIRKNLFMSYAREIYSQDQINERAFALLTLITEYNEVMTVQNLKERKHPIIKGIYQDIKTYKTIRRDLEIMEKAKLIVITPEGALKPNVSIMDQFQGKSKESTRVAR